LVDKRGPPPGTLAHECALQFSASRLLSPDGRRGVSCLAFLQDLPPQLETGSKVI